MSNQSQTEYGEYLINIRENTNAYFNIILSSVGIPCNIISIFIFARLMRNKNNMGFLYVWQCSVDLLALLFSLLLIRSNETFGIELSNQSDFACKCLTFLRRFILHASSFISIITTFDRFTFVLYGHGERFKFIKSKRNITYIILVSFTVILIIDIPNFFFYLWKNGECRADFEVQISSDIISTFFRTYLPFFIMLIFNIFMIRKIVENNRNLSNQTNHSRKENHFTVAVIAFDIFFFIVNFPLSLAYILCDINFYSDVFHEYYILVYNITINISFFKQAFSFFLYFSCNKLFRNELLFIFTRIFFFHSPSESTIPNSIHF